MIDPKSKVGNEAVALGGRLREERKRLGLTQAQLAQRIGIAAPTQVGYEQGQRAPDVHYLAAFLRLGGDVHYVMTEVRAVEYAVDSLDWEHFTAVREAVKKFLQEVELELPIGQLVEVERLVYQLTLKDRQARDEVIGRILKLVVSR